MSMVTPLNIATGRLVSDKEAVMSKFTATCFSSGRSVWVIAGVICCWLSYKWGSSSLKRHSWAGLLGRALIFIMYIRASCSLLRAIGGSLASTSRLIMGEVQKAPNDIRRAEFCTTRRGFRRDSLVLRMSGARREVLWLLNFPWLRGAQVKKSGVRKGP